MTKKNTIENSLSNLLDKKEIELEQKETNLSRFLEWLEFTPLCLFFYQLWKGNYGIKYWPKNIKWTIQRATRGYADCDLWNLNYFLGNHIVKCLTAFKKMDRCGVPAEYTDKTLKDGSTKNVSVKVGQKNWDKDIQDMIDGFSFLTNEVDFWQSIHEKCGKDNKKTMVAFEKANIEAQSKAQKFIEHLGSLWD